MPSPNPPHTLGLAIDQAVLALKERQVTATPRLEAQVLAAHVCECERWVCWAYPERLWTEAQWQRWQTLLQRRLQGEPLAYLLGYKEFYGRRFCVDARVLIPRPDTEVVVEVATKLLQGRLQPRILDVGAGSGCLGITLACERPDAKVDGWDVSAAACACSRHNHSRLGGQVTIHQRDALEPGSWEGGAYDMVVSNPPYIGRAEWEGLDPSVRQWEPTLALLADQGGLAFYQCLSRWAPQVLKPSGQLVVEVGYRQAAAVSELLRTQGWQVKPPVLDYAGHARVVHATPPQNPLKA